MGIKNLIANKWVKRGGIAIGVVVVLDILIAAAIIAAAYYGFSR